MYRSSFETKSLVDSVDELINLVENWEMLHDPDNNNNPNHNSSKKRNKKRSHANAMPDQVMLDQTPAKKSRLINSTKQLRNCLADLSHDAKLLFSQVMASVIQRVYKVQLTDEQMDTLIVQQMSRPKHDRGDFAVPCFRFTKLLKTKPMQIAETLSDEINKDIGSNSDALYVSNPFVKVEALKGYLNIYLAPSYLGNIVDLILNESDSFLGRLPWDKKRCQDIKRVMVEYSQPNTHKAFHVGHMRNVALGDCLVRLYEHCGYDVIAANYFGDEGAHVAKCLWLLQKKIDSGIDLDGIAPAEGKGEWLGAFYTEAVQKLSIKTYTTLPFKGVVSAIVLSKKKHPNVKAPPNWNVVEVDFGAKQQATVVCGGSGYEVGDYVPYVAIGGKFNKKDVVPKDMMGVQSSGVIMSAKELGIVIEEFDKLLKDIANEGKTEEEKSDAANNTSEKAKVKENEQDSKKEEAKKKSDEPKGKEQKGKKGKKQKKKKQEKKKKVEDKRILVLNKFFDMKSMEPGKKVIDVGRLDGTDIDSKQDIEEIISKRDQEQRKALHGLEKEDPQWVKLWHKTRQWSLDDFHGIYNWVGARFDHDFCESECSARSRKLVDEFVKKGVFTMDNGATGIHLGDELGFCMLLKSDGSGLYATKDIALAQIKFEKYKIDKSIYVVDSAQSHHFAQVFATLEAMKYPQAKNCFHLAYAFVTLPEGRMASRIGRVVAFSELREMLGQEIKDKILNRKKDKDTDAKDSKDDGDDADADDDAVQTSGDLSKAAKDAPAGKKRGWVKRVTDERKWTEEEQANAVRLISVGTIRYGMLNHDPNKEIVFDLKQWSDASGDTGPYLMYQYTRVSSIGRNVARPDAPVAPDYGLLNSADERKLLYELSQFQNRVQDACENANPSVFCTYLYNIAQGFSAWYSRPENNIKLSPDDITKVTRLNFAEAIASTLRQGLSLLGIQVLERM